jgi:hypothetical protein
MVHNVHATSLRAVALLLFFCGIHMTLWQRGGECPTLSYNIHVAVNNNNNNNKQTQNLLYHYDWMLLVEEGHRRSFQLNEARLVLIGEKTTVHLVY